MPEPYSTKQKGCYIIYHDVCQQYNGFFIVWSTVSFLLSMSTQKAKVFVTCYSRVFVVVLERLATQADG